MIREASELYYLVYKRYPIPTAIASAIMLAIFIPTMMYFDKQHARKRELERAANLQYSNQMSRLNEVETGLKNLQEYIEAQKSALKDNEDTIASLRAEQERLKPLVEANKKVVDAIFELQLKKAQATIWRERAIGFISGVLSSIVASLVIASFVFLAKRRRKQ